MVVSSRTPEGFPLECPVCGEWTRFEVSFPTDDACCPKCGELLHRTLHRVIPFLGRPLTSWPPGTRFRRDLGSDSSALIELSMELEEIDERCQELYIEDFPTVGALCAELRRRDGA